MIYWETELQEVVICKDGPKNTPYGVYSQITGRKFGYYRTLVQAEKKLARMERIKCNVLIFFHKTP